MQSIGFIAINKAVRHHDQDFIALLMNHCVGEKGGAEKKNKLRQLKYIFLKVQFILICLFKNYIKSLFCIKSVFCIMCYPETANMLFNSIRWTAA